MSWRDILKEVDYPLTENLTWNGNEYFYHGEETTMATPNGVLYLYKDLKGNVIKLYLSDNDKIKEWTDDDQKEFDMESHDQMFNVKGEY